MLLLNLGLSLWLVVNFVVNLKCAQQYPSLHPKFQVPPASDPGIRVLTELDSDNKIWYPTVPTFLFQRENHLSKFTLLFTIEDVFNGIPKVSVKYGCSANGVDSLNISHKVVLCSDEQEVGFQVASIDRISASSIKFTLFIQPSELFNRTFPAKYEKFNFIIVGNGWSLTSNLVYLYKWNFQADFQYNFIESNRNTSSTTVEACLSDYDKQSVFNDTELFTTNIMKFIAEAPIFYKSFVTAAVLVQVGADFFQSDREYLTIGTGNDPSQWNEHDANSNIVVRGSFKSHKSYCSNFGLINLASRFASSLPSSPFYCFSEPDCTPVLVCSVFWNSLLQEQRHCPRSFLFQTTITVAKSKLVYQQGKSTCTVMKDYDKNITIFAAFPNIVMCPIVCSNDAEIFGFYKGKTPLLPNSRANNWFTRLGALKILQSGFAIQFEAFASNEDSGEYMCSAGGKQAKFRINIVTLPSFYVPNSTWVDGRLPDKIYVFPGDKYSVKCTAYYSGLKSVTINPHFYLEEKASQFRKVDKSALMQIWKSQTVPFHFNIDISVTSNAYSTTLTLSVDKVPPLSKQSQQFNHRFLCSAELSVQDLKDYFGFPEYKIETGSDVTVFPLPDLNDFLINHTKCCQTECMKDVCRMEVTLKPDVSNYLRSLGLEIRAQFSAPIALQQKSLQDWIRTHSMFDAVNARLTWEMKEGVKQLKDENKAILFPNLIATFTYTNPLAKGAASILKISRPMSLPPAAVMKAASDCLSDPSCVYSTAFNETVSDALTVANQLAIEQKKIVDLKDDISIDNSREFRQKLTDLQERFMAFERESREKTGSHVGSNTGLVMITVHIVSIICSRWISPFISLLLLILS